MHAGFGPGRVEDELRLPVFLENGVVAIHYDRTVSVPVGSHANAENAKIDAKREE